MSLQERGSLNNLESMINHQANSGGGGGDVDDALKDLENSLNEGFARINEAIDQNSAIIQDISKIGADVDWEKVEELTNELNNTTGNH